MRFNTATLGELRDLVADLIDEHGEDMPVAIDSDYGDYAHTRQLHALGQEEPQIVQVTDEAYSRSGFGHRSIEPDNDGYDHVDEDKPRCILLN